MIFCKFIMPFFFTASVVQTNGRIRVQQNNSDPDEFGSTAPVWYSVGFETCLFPPLVAKTEDRSRHRILIKIMFCRTWVLLKMMYFGTLEPFLMIFSGPGSLLNLLSFPGLTGTSGSLKNLLSFLGLTST